MPLQQIRYNAYSSWSTDMVATSTSGSDFTPLNQQPADEVEIVIPAGGDSIDVIASGQRDQTKFVTINAPAALVVGFIIPVGGDASEISVRRTDLSDTPLNVRYIWRKTRR